MTDETFTQRLVRETRALQGLSARIDDDPVNVDLAARFLAVAVADSSRARRAVEGSASGAAGSVGLGKCPEPSRPRNDKTAATRQRAAVQNNAG